MSKFIIWSYLKIFFVLFLLQFLPIFSVKQNHHVISCVNNQFSSAQNPTGNVYFYMQFRNIFAKIEDLTTPLPDPQIIFDEAENLDSELKENAVPKIIQIQTNDSTEKNNIGQEIHYLNTHYENPKNRLTYLKRRMQNKKAIKKSSKKGAHRKTEIIIFKKKIKAVIKK